MDTGWREEELLERKKSLKIVRSHNKDEEKKIKMGWKYVHITPKMQVLIPCDRRNGKPTDEGLRIIDKWTKMMNKQY